MTINVQTNTQSSRTGISRINVNRLNTVLTPTLLRVGCGQVLIREDVPQLLAGHLAALSVSTSLNNLRELNLSTTRQIQTVILLQQVRHTALTGLRVHTNNRLVGTTQVARINRQVRNLPVNLIHGLTRLSSSTLQSLKALLNSVLVRTRERGEHQIATIRRTLVHLQLVAVLNSLTDTVNIREINLRIHTLGVHVQAQRHQVNVTGALAITEEATLNTVSARQVTQLSSSHTGTAVIVRVQRQHNVLAVVQVAVHPLDRVGVHVRGSHLNGSGQVHNQLAAVLTNLQLLSHSVHHASRVLKLGAGERLGRVLVDNLSVRNHLLFVLAAQARTLQGDIQHALLILVEHHATLQNGGRVVEVHNRLRCALNRLKSAGNQMLTRLHQNLNGHIRRNVAVLNESAHKIKVSLRRRGETNLNFLVTHLHQQLEHCKLTVGVHGVNQRLVAVTQIHCAPARSLLNDLIRPGAVRQVNNNLLVERAVLVYRHGAGLLVVFHDEFPVGWSVSLYPNCGARTVPGIGPRQPCSRRCIRKDAKVRCRVKKPERLRQILACPVPANKQQVHCLAGNPAHALTVNSHTSTLSQRSEAAAGHPGSRPSSGKN